MSLHVFYPCLLLDLRAQYPGPMVQDVDVLAQSYALQRLSISVRGF